MPIALFRIVDKYVIGFLNLLFFGLKYFFYFRRNTIIQYPKKILVIRLRALGSSLLTFPMIKQLRDYYGNHVQYDLLATSRNIGIFKNQGYFNNQYNLFSLKDLIKLFFGFKTYDIVIDAEEYFMISAFMSMWLGKVNVGYNNIKIRGLVYVFRYMYAEYQHNIINCLHLIKKLGVPIYKPSFMEKLVYKQTDTVKVDTFLKQFNNKTLICMHTGGAETSIDRFWALENWIQLIKKILDNYGNKVVIFLSGTKFEEQGVKKILQHFKQHDNVISICGMFTLFEFAYFLEKCNIMISNDTGPMHLAAAMGTKTIGLFGPNLPERFGPWPLDKNVGLYKGDGKVHIFPHLGIFKQDKKHTVNYISVGDVLFVVNSFLGK